MLLDSLMLQTKLFLQDDMGLTIKEADISEAADDTLKLKDYTSMIGVGGKLSLMIIISYDEKMLHSLTQIFLDGEKADPSEEDEIYDSVAGEVINTIMGLALPTFPNRGKGITITPPVSLRDTSSFIKQKSSVVVSIEIQTNAGALSISIVTTKKPIL